MVGHFWVWIYFSRPLSLFESCPDFFFCVHIPRAIKVNKFQIIPMKPWFKKNYKYKILQSEVTEDRTRVNTYKYHIGVFLIS